MGRRRSYPYAIDNGGGERLTFTGVTSGPGGERLEADGIAQPGAGPPMHVHYLQEEGVQVIRGCLGYQLVGGEPQYAGPGDVVVWPAGTGHKWWNAGSDPLHMSGWCSPPDNVEFFLGTLFASTRANGGGRPGLFDAAFLTMRYRTEFALLELPAVARYVVMPCVYVMGTLLGKYRKFKDAPAPMSSARRRSGHATAP